MPHSSAAGRLRRSAGSPVSLGAWRVSRSCVTRTSRRPASSSRPSCAAAPSPCTLPSLSPRRRAEAPRELHRSGAPFSFWPSGGGELCPGAPVGRRKKKKEGNCRQGRDVTELRGGRRGTRRRRRWPHCIRTLLSSVSPLSPCFFWGGGGISSEENAVVLRASLAPPFHAHDVLTGTRWRTQQQLQQQVLHLSPTRGADAAAAWKGHSLSPPLIGGHTPSSLTVGRWTLSVRVQYVTRFFGFIFLIFFKVQHRNLSQWPLNTPYLLLV